MNLKTLVKYSLIVALPVLVRAQAPVAAGGGVNGPSGAAMGRTSSPSEEAMTGQVPTANAERTIVKEPEATPVPHRHVTKKAKKKSND